MKVEESFQEQPRHKALEVVVRSPPHGEWTVEGGRMVALRGGGVREDGLSCTLAPYKMRHQAFFLGA
jgi:hypothetical protein